MKLKNYLFFLSILFHLSVSINAQIINGSDLLFSENLGLINDKNIGVVCNHTALLSDGTHLVDALINQKNVRLKAIFTPEHGFKGLAEAGKIVDYKNNFYRNIPIVSLYGKDRKPSSQILKNIDLLIFDIQDVGARFYTYISTMYYVLEAAAENQIPVIILDRPNPIGGLYVDGPVLDIKFKSFIGIAPIPIAYGMTVGELAKFFIGEKLISNSDKIKLNVIKCKNWHREIPAEFYSEWNSPSPNINSLETALAYPGICLLEGTNVSEGRGTMLPFLQFGAPFIKADKVVEKLNQLKVDGVQLSTVTFTPVDIESMASDPKYKNKVCEGIKIKIVDPDKFESVKFGVKLLYVLSDLFGNEFKFNNASFDRLAGTDKLRIQLENKIEPDIIFTGWQKDLSNFKIVRNKYLLY